MVKVIAVREYRHGGTTHYPGDEAEVSEKEARVLTRVKNAPFKLADSGAPKYEVPRAVAAFKSPPVVAKATEEEDPSRPRRYLRRDMTAKE